MRLFVNVYSPTSKNCVHASRKVADEQQAKTRLACVEIEDTNVSDAPNPADPHCRYAHTAAELQALFPVSASQTVSTLSPSDVVTVGDLNSSARGTGARKSAGKPDWSQLPWWALTPIAGIWINSRPPLILACALRAMGQWQRGQNEGLEEAGAICLGLLAKKDGIFLPDGYPIRAYIPVIRVLEFGEKKYAKGNWAKGMSWSVCYSCTMSHLTKAFAGEENDEESGLTHLAHALCNIIFLLGYRDLYPEGDDRLPEFEVKS